MAKKKTQILKSQVIAIAGAFIRSGCTHMCVALANHLSQKGHSVAVIEYNDSGHIAAIAEAENIPISEEGMFVKNKCHYYIYDDSYVSVVNRQYDYVIADYGYIQDCNKNMFYISDFCILTSMTSPWDMKHLYQVINGEEEHSRNRLIYAFMLCEDKQKQKDLKNTLYFTDKIVFLPFINDDLECLDHFLNLETDSGSKKKVIPLFGFMKKPLKQEPVISDGAKNNFVEEVSEHPYSQKTEIIKETPAIGNNDIVIETKEEPEILKEEYEEPIVEIPNSNSTIDIDTNETVDVPLNETIENESISEEITPEETISDIFAAALEDENIPEEYVEKNVGEAENIIEQSAAETEPSKICDEIEEDTNSEVLEKQLETFDNQTEDIVTDDVAVEDTEIPPLFIEPEITEEEKSIRYIPDKLTGYKAKSEMCYIYKTFNLEEIHGNYLKQFKIVAYPLGYDDIKPVRMIIGIFYNNKVYTISSPEDKFSITFEEDGEKLLFNGQFTNYKFDVNISSLNEQTEIKDIKMLKQAQPKSLPDAFPIYTGQCIEINDHVLLLYPLYTQNGPLGRCAFMYYMTYPDGGNMVGTSENDYIALIPIQGVVQSVECRWIKLGNEKHLVANLL